jgi:N-acetylglutamate synthase-like GNAT family acetyltransferase
MKIRKATQKDVPQILKIIRSNNPKYPKRLMKKEIKEMFSRALLKPTYLIVEQERKIIGCGGFTRSWADNTIFNIFWINILPDFQGKGIGTRLIKGMVKTIKGIKEKPKAKMITLSTNKPRLYKKIGFEKLGKKYDGDYFLMGKVIR